MVSPKKLFPVSAVGGYVGAHKAEETLGYILFINLFIFRQGVQISMNLLDDTVFIKQCSGNKQRIL